MFQTLREVGVSSETLQYRTIEAFNKIDKLQMIHTTPLYVQSLPQSGQLQIKTAVSRRGVFDHWLGSLRKEEGGFHAKRVLISALNGTGLNELRHRIEEMVLAYYQR